MGGGGRVGLWGRVVEGGGRVVAEGGGGGGGREGEGRDKRGARHYSPP